MAQPLARESQAAAQSTTIGKLTIQRLAGISGLVFAIATLAGAFMAPIPPDLTAAPAKFLTYYIDHRSLLLAQELIGILTAVPAFLFLGGLWHRLRAADGEQGILAPAAIAAFGCLVVMAVIGSAWPGAVAYLAGNGLDESSAKSLTVLSLVIGNATFVPVAVLCLISGYLFAVRGATTGIPIWAGWLGILAGCVSFAAVFSVGSSALFRPFGVVAIAGFVAFNAYIAILSVFMVRDTN